MLTIRHSLLLAQGSYLVPLMVCMLAHAARSSPHQLPSSTQQTSPSCLQAGLLVAETEFAMQVESDIAPYKGLLMGLFFMTVGMEISVGLFFAEWKAIISGIVLLIVGKVRPGSLWHLVVLCDLGLQGS